MVNFGKIKCFKRLCLSNGVKLILDAMHRIYAIKNIKIELPEVYKDLQSNFRLWDDHN